ncbi:hypothetical protein M407DRAFT_6069 [Tulasnella calospora MUT 4182]|uniref:Uncharacterized protein n=1 Tax=Tulasnella calospora MUT 4182 TaxID=1051891 RepID=A0A0C3M7H4_9AGAM|nr:hypothetical protein M407DRAFT_6069 [Tulasnella calospora MUT 4182]
MRRFSQPLLVALLLVVLVAPASIVVHKKRSSHRVISDLTNAERFARGLPPATPRQLHSPNCVKGRQVSQGVLNATLELKLAISSRPANSLGYLSYNEDEEMWVIGGNAVWLSSSASTPFRIWARTSGGTNIYFHLNCPNGDDNNSVYAA